MQYARVQCYMASKRIRQLSSLHELRFESLEKATQWPDQALATKGGNRRSVPERALKYDSSTGRVFVNMYCNEGQGIRNEFVGRICWTAPEGGDRTSIEFDFNWDGHEMKYRLFYGNNQEVPFTIENYYDV
ncbi:hypothetical protein IL306_014185 [Fusarium sp. DS 682]|nr:hypothetical protein IL306_014185 [Fusarium sp. DS 682]